MPPRPRGHKPQDRGVTRYGCTQFTVRILRSAKSPECVGPRTPTVVWFSAVTSARLTSECEPPYPALHNRSFRPPSSSTQPPTGAHVTRRPRRVPSMGLHLQRAPPVAGSTSSELHLLQALPPASSTCCRLYLQRAPPVAATVDGAGCAVRTNDGAGRALSGRRLGASCAAARLSAATPPNGRAVLGRRLY